MFPGEPMPIPTTFSASLTAIPIVASSAAIDRLEAEVL